MTRMQQGPWHRLDAFLARLRPYREPVSLLVDAAVVAACWNVTYLFRLGFERWISARPGYDGWVLLGIVGVYALASPASRQAPASRLISPKPEKRHMPCGTLAAAKATA